MRRMECASKKRTVLVITVERATHKARLYRLSVILAHAKTLSGSARTKFVQVIFFLFEFAINYSHYFCVREFAFNLALHYTEITFFLQEFVLYGAIRIIKHSMVKHMIFKVYATMF